MCFVPFLDIMASPTSCTEMPPQAYPPRVWECTRDDFFPGKHCRFAVFPREKSCWYWKGGLIWWSHPGGVSGSEKIWQRSCLQMPLFVAEDWFYCQDLGEWNGCLAVFIFSMHEPPPTPFFGRCVKLGILEHLQVDFLQHKLTWQTMTACTRLLLLLYLCMTGVCIFFAAAKRESVASPENNKVVLSLLSLHTRWFFSWEGLCICIPVFVMEPQVCSFPFRMAYAANLRFHDAAEEYKKNYDGVPALLQTRPVSEWCMFLE